MEWLLEFVKWFSLVALIVGGPTLLYRHFLHEDSYRRTRRKLERTERRVRQLNEITARFERLEVEQRALEARSAALQSNDVHRLAMLQRFCTGLEGKAEAERRVPGSTGLERDLEAVLDAAAALGDEYSRSASLGHAIDLYVRAGLHEKARSHARWVTDPTVRARLNQDPNIAPLLQHGTPPLLLMQGEAGMVSAEDGGSDSASSASSDDASSGDGSGKD